MAAKTDKCKAATAMTVNGVLTVLPHSSFTLNGYRRLFTMGESEMTISETAGQRFLRYEDAAQEDRSAPRVRLMRPSGSQGFAVVVKDLSLSGVACEALTGMGAGTRVWLTLPGLNALQAKIVWNDGTMVGCEFDTLLNVAVMENVLARYPAQAG
jgi:PilZ domain